MKMVTFTLFIVISCIGYIGSAKEGKERIRVATSLFQVFDDNYYAAVSKQNQCTNLKNQATYFLSSTCSDSSYSCDLTFGNDLKENFICFCSTLSPYKLQKPTAEWIFSSAFVQYSAIQAIFSLTVCRIYNLYALEIPNKQQADDCAKVVSYLNTFRAIVIQDRMTEIEKIYELAGESRSGRRTKARLNEQKSKGYHSFNMLSQQSRFFKLDDLLDRLTDVIEVEGSHQIPSLSCEGTFVNKDRKHSFPLDMYLDFYINANVNAEKSPSYGFESIENKYKRGISNFAWDESYREYYYREAWFDIFYIFYLDFFPMVNYFNKILYGDQSIKFCSGAFEPFIPPIKESLKVWEEIHKLRKMIDTEYNDNRSKVIKILRGILMANVPNDEFVTPMKIQLKYINNEVDFSIDLKK